MNGDATFEAECYRISITSVFWLSFMAGAFLGVILWSMA
jgi:hypothetical protein